MLEWILPGISIPIIVSGYLWRRSIIRKGAPSLSKKDKRLKLFATALVVVGAFLLLTHTLDLIFGPRENEGLEFSLWPERIEVLGFSLSHTIIYTWVAMAILIITALVIRLTVFRNPKDTPGGAQNVVEFIVEAVGNYTNAQTHGAGEMLASYILTIAALMVTCAFLELFRIRPPTSDITMTFSMALITFILINAYGIKKKGVVGRIKSLASPTPLVFPFRMIADMAIPVSMACRLFGNMLGGMIVIDLLYSALGSNAIGIPSVAGLYFNAFHPIIQAFIFVTLTLTFINEAIE